MVLDTKPFELSKNKDDPESEREKD